MATIKLCSKILLFGEYSVIKGSMALALPYDTFEAKLDFRNSSQDQELLDFALYLRGLEPDNKKFLNIDTKKLCQDIKQGLYFSSSIPQGYGLGSSGALCSAIFKKYGKDEKTLDLNSLKEKFAIMESYFHGESSGFDPLVSYYNEPISIDENKKLCRVKIPQVENPQHSLFLLDTGRGRRTEPLVNLFLEKIKDSKFAETFEEEYIGATNKAIKSFLNGDNKSLLNCFHSISAFQFTHLKAMIPKLYHKVWERGLDSNDYYLKLCGAGGGGYLLGMSHSNQAIINQKNNFHTKLITNL